MKRTNKNPMAKEPIKVGQTELFEEDPKKKGSKSGSIGLRDHQDFDRLEECCSSNKKVTGFKISNILIFLLFFSLFSTLSAM